MSPPTPLLVLLPSLLSGCLLPTAAPSEVAEGTVSVGGKRAWFQYDDESWTGGANVSGRVDVQRDDSTWVPPSDGTQVSIFGDRWALPRLTYDGQPARVIELAAAIDLRDWLTADLAIALFHRQAGRVGPWKPVDCQMSPSQDRLVGIDLEYYEPDGLFIDLEQGSLTARLPNDAGSATAPLVACGVIEPHPEFAAFVLPQYAWGNMEGAYGYTLSAWCDGAWCPEYVGDPTGSP